MFLVSVELKTYDSKGQDIIDLQLRANLMLAVSLFFFIKVVEHKFEENLTKIEYHNRLRPNFWVRYHLRLLQNRYGF